MGCDIHVYAEKRLFPDRNRSNPGVWTSIDKWTVSEDKILYPEDYEDCPEMEIAYGDAFYSGRNYLLFYILAGVRGYDEWGPRIADPKGTPGDSCKHIKQEVERWKCDAHSHSYLTLSDLLSFDWNAKIEDEITVLDKKAEPMVAKLDPEDLISHEKEERGKHTLHRIRYMRPYKDFFPEFMDTIARMNEQINTRLNETTDDIRLVFFFDN
ncbi:hypothetical protein MOB78_13260 [Bacillus spizizenii]|nr:hypothetical protein [Bacillus spizizenii]